MECYLVAIKSNNNRVISCSTAISTAKRIDEWSDKYANYVIDQIIWKNHRILSNDFRKYASTICMDFLLQFLRAWKKKRWILLPLLLLSNKVRLYGGSRWLFKCTWSVIELEARALPKWYQVKKFGCHCCYWNVVKAVKRSGSTSGRLRKVHFIRPANGWELVLKNRILEERFNFFWSWK